MHLSCFLKLVYLHKNKANNGLGLLIGFVTVSNHYMLHFKCFYVQIVQKLNIIDSAKVLDTQKQL